MCKILEAGGREGAGMVQQREIRARAGGDHQLLEVDRALTSGRRPLVILDQTTAGRSVIACLIQCENNWSLLA
jgi:hypothetical protein